MWEEEILEQAISAVKQETGIEIEVLGLSYSK